MFIDNDSRDEGTPLGVPCAGQSSETHITPKGVRIEAVPVSINIQPLRGCAGCRT